MNLVYYDDSFLLARASGIGKPVKVDLNILKVAQGRFARVCVEINLTQPVVGRVGVEGKWYNVEYERLHVICAQCGYYGHLLKDCLVKKAPVVAVEEGAKDQKQEEAISDPKQKLVDGEKSTIIPDIG